MVRSGRQRVPSGALWGMVAGGGCPSWGWDPADKKEGVGQRMRGDRRDWALTDWGGGDEEGRGEEDTPTRNLAQELRGQKLFLTRKE